MGVTPEPVLCTVGDPEQVLSTAHELLLLHLTMIEDLYVIRVSFCVKSRDVLCR